MSVVRNPRRRLDLDRDPLWGCEGFQEQARHASFQLANALMLTGLSPDSAEPRARTFEEQLALVESGRARVVPKPKLRPTEERTLAGVSSEWMA